MDFKGRVYDYIKLKLKDHPLHFSLIDPDVFKQAKDEDLHDRYLTLAKDAYEAGSDVILIGGSTGIYTTFVDELIKDIKKRSQTFL